MSSGVDEDGDSEEDDEDGEEETDEIVKDCHVHLSLPDHVVVPLKLPDHVPLNLPDHPHDVMAPDINVVMEQDNDEMQYKPDFIPRDDDVSDGSIDIDGASTHDPGAAAASWSDNDNGNDNENDNDNDNDPPPTNEDNNDHEEEVEEEVYTWLDSGDDDFDLYNNKEDFEELYNNNSYSSSNQPPLLPPRVGVYNNRGCEPTKFDDDVGDVEMMTQLTGDGDIERPGDGEDGGGDESEDFLDDDNMSHSSSIQSVNSWSTTNPETKAQMKETESHVVLCACYYCSAFRPPKRLRGGGATDDNLQHERN